MSSDWESIVSIARGIDEAYAKGDEPEAAAVVRFARAVLEFQQRLRSPQVNAKSGPAPESPGNTPEAAKLERG